MNKILVACAGSGKTTYLVKRAYQIGHNVLITTFTDNNTDEIKLKFIKKYGFLPSNVTIIPWFTFQLDHLIRPYQISLIDERILNIKLVSGKSAKYISKNNKEYYVKSGEVYSDKISCLAYRTLKENKNTIIRLKRIFDYILIDEFQDFAGYDLEITKFLAQENFNLEIVCDPRQHTFSTHYDQKNKKFLCEPLKFIQEKCNGLFNIDTSSLNGSFRCPQNTIRYASEIFPDLPQSDSLKEYEKGDGICFLKDIEVDIFLKNTPSVLQLRDSKKTKVKDGYCVTTFGKSKGLTAENTIIYPTKQMLYAILNNFTNFKSKSDLYVALTRAKHKTAIIVPTKDYLKYQKVSEHINSYLTNPKKLK